MYTKKQELEQLADAAESGDTLAAAALADRHEEDGLPAVTRPKRGDWLVICTATFYHLGQLLAEDHEYYHLAPGSWVVYETGPLKMFYGEGKAKYAEAMPVASWVRKGPTVLLSAWAHGPRLSASTGE
jgi:hypothetical protein